MTSLESSMLSAPLNQDEMKLEDALRRNNVYEPEALTRKR